MKKGIDRTKAIESLFTFNLENNEVAFIYLGYSGIILRVKDTVIAIDPGKSIDKSEISAIGNLDLLLFTHSHWDHFTLDYALEIFQKTGVHVVADCMSAEELKGKLPHDKLTIGDSGSSSILYNVEGYEVIALRGVHVGPISQYLVKLEGLNVFHGGDSGYWRHKEHSADIAFVPTGTASTCAPGVALAMVIDLQPKVVVGMHGNNQVMRQFKALMEKVSPSIETIIPRRFEPIRVSI